MIVTTDRLISPRELRINKPDLIWLLLQVLVKGKNVRIKGLNNDVVFLASENNYPIPRTEEVIQEVEAWT